MLSKKEKKLRAAKAVEVLKEKYPSAECALQYNGDPWPTGSAGKESPAMHEPWV